MPGWLVSRNMSAARPWSEPFHVAFEAFSRMSVCLRLALRFTRLPSPPMQFPSYDIRRLGKERKEERQEEEFLVCFFLLSFQSISLVRKPRLGVSNYLCPVNLVGEKQTHLGEGGG